MPDEKPTPREKRLEALALHLAGKLAILFAYVAAIDDVVDPFAPYKSRDEFDALLERQWTIATLTASCRNELFRGSLHMQPWGIDCSDIIEAAEVQQSIRIEQSELYRKSREAITGIIREWAERETPH